VVLSFVCYILHGLICVNVIGSINEIIGLFPSPKCALNVRTSINFQT
jgi:hypothetical protein